MIRGFITAIRTLTILPIPGKDAEKLSSSLYWFPVVGLCIGGILYGVSILPGIYSLKEWPEGIAVILLMLTTILTRGLHLDGLSDWADGFWGGHNRKRILEIMKDSSIGTFGGAALISVMLAKWVCFARLISNSSHIWIIAPFIISRTMQTVLASSYKYARSEHGTGKSFIDDAKGIHLIVNMALTFAILFALYRFQWQWIAALAVGWLTTRLFGICCCRRIGGATGDLLGASSEFVETILLALLSVLC